MSTSCHLLKSIPVPFLNQEQQQNSQLSLQVTRVCRTSALCRSQGLHWPVFTQIQKRRLRICQRQISDTRRGRTKGMGSRAENCYTQQARDSNCQCTRLQQRSRRHVQLLPWKAHRARPRKQLTSSQTVSEAFQDQQPYSFNPYRSFLLSACELQNVSGLRPALLSYVLPGSLKHQDTPDTSKAQCCVHLRVRFLSDLIKSKGRLHICL